jgi:antitoxin PrlF
MELAGQASTIWINSLLFTFSLLLYFALFYVRICHILACKQALSHRLVGIMMKSRVTSKGQTTLPKDVRQSLQIETGDILRYVITGKDEVLIRKARPATALSGMLKRDAPASVSLDDMEYAIRKGAVRDGMKSDR